MAKAKKKVSKQKVSKKKTSHKFPKPDLLQIDDIPNYDDPEITNEAYARDQLAAQLAAGICATRTQHPIEKLAESTDEIAVVAYLLADKMKMVAKLDPLALNRQLALIKTRKNPVQVQQVIKVDDKIEL